MSNEVWSHGLVTGDLVIKKDDGFLYEVDELGELEWVDRWSKTPPTEEGYYWLYVPEWNLDPEIVLVFNSGGVADPCYEFNRMMDGFKNPDYVTAPTDAQWMKIPTQANPKG